MGRGASAGLVTVLENDIGVDFVTDEDDVVFSAETYDCLESGGGERLAGRVGWRVDEHDAWVASGSNGLIQCRLERAGYLD